MKTRSPFGIILLWLLTATAIYAQTNTPTALQESKTIAPEASRIYLKNGESIEGKLIKVNEDSITIESNKNYGILTIPKRDILLIEFRHTEVKLNRRYGLGYISKTYIISAVENTLNYNVNMISLKTYFSDDSFALQWYGGYGSATVTVLDRTRSGCTDRTQTGCTIKRNYNVFQAGLRGAFTAQKQQNALLYYGLGAGIISLTNDAENVNESGGAFSLFVGAELFLNEIPNFGFSGEIALDYISTPSVSRTDINVSPIPTFSVHYYF